MAQSLTKSSPKASPKTHSDATRLTRKDGVYYYRRRLPGPDGTDVAISLGTRNYREAEHLAENLDVVFNGAANSVTAPAALRTVLRDYLREALADDAELRLTTRSGVSLYAANNRDDERDPVDVDLGIIDDLLGDAREQLGRRDFAVVSSTVDALAAEYAIPVEQRNALAHGVLEVHVKSLEEVRRRILGQGATILTDEPVAAIVAASPVAPAGPLLSVAMKSYRDYGAKEKAWRGQTQAQTGATFAMFQQVAGDRAVGSYTRSDLSGFYDTLRALPPLYAKDRRWRGMTLAEIVTASADEVMPRLAMKTIKRHFSALGGFFDHAKRHGQYQGDNPAYGFEFPTRGRSNSGRKVWEGEKLTNLFKSPVWTGCHPVFRSQVGTKIIRDEKYWLPLLGLYHGNRLEEFAQLRGEDVKEKDGVPYFHIHGGDGRQIKNEQSARRVPIHPALEALGFIEYVRTTAPTSNDPLFPLLGPGGPDNKLGYYFTKWWTNYRRSVGLYEPGLDYHSFRHGVTTKLFAANVARDIIDELTGHEGEGTSQTVYKHDTPLPVLRDAIAKVQWPELPAL